MVSFVACGVSMPEVLFAQDLQCGPVTNPTIHNTSYRILGKTGYRRPVTAICERCGLTCLPAGSQEYYTLHQVSLPRVSTWIKA